MGHILRSEKVLRCEGSEKRSRRKPYGFFLDSSCEMLLKNASFTGRIAVVSTDQPESVRSALELLRGETVVGLDVETKPNTRKAEAKNNPALLQLASDSACVIVMLRQPPLPLVLKEFLEDGSIVKAGVGVEDDAKEVRRAFNVGCAGLQDLLTLGALLECRPRSLKALTQIFLGLNLQKPRKIQMSDWSRASLSQSQLRYAATDAWVGREIYFAMIDFLDRRKSGVGLPSTKAIQA
eukprot:g1496.t1